MLGQRFGQVCQKTAQHREKQWAIESPKLGTSTRLRGIYFIDPNDMELKDTMKNVRNKLELSMKSAIPCKLQNLRHGETYGENKSNTRTSKYACIVEDHESARQHALESLRVQFVESIQSCA